MYFKLNRTFHRRYQRYSNTFSFFGPNHFLNPIEFILSDLRPSSILGIFSLLSSFVLGEYVKWENAFYLESSDGSGYLDYLACSVSAHLVSKFCEYLLPIKKSVKCNEVRWIFGWYIDCSLTISVVMNPLYLFSIFFSAWEVEMHQPNWSCLPQILLR
jgi:hypothetical protein